MRNVFDQYEQPENRLSHGLAVCLHEDGVLVQAFLTWIGIEHPIPGQTLMIVEQSLPGNAPRIDDEGEAERRGLPDIVIHDGSAWCLFIESKIKARLTGNQLRRQKSTLRRRGFERVECLVLTKADVRVPRGAIARRWSELYQWLGQSSNRREWPDNLRSYLRAAEARLAHAEYLTEGTLTMFDGFSFSEDNPYTYLEAKRLLKLAMRELRKDRGLIALGMDRKGSGRGAITGRTGSSVWDFLPLVDRPRGGVFTKYPHLTLSVHADRLEVAITIPNGVIGPVRRRLATLGHDDLISLNATILRRAKHLLARGASVWAYAEQRHFLGQRSAQIRDARLQFKLETSQPRGGTRVKHQAEWIIGFGDLLRMKRSNIQFGYAITLPWGTRGLDSRQSLRLVVESWKALKPLLEAMRRR
jgi:hypothetical protein